MEMLFQFSPEQAVLIVGVSLTVMFILSIIIQFRIFEKIVVTGYALTTIQKIDSSGSMFWVAVVGWVIVYALDAVISSGLYVMFSSTSESLASTSAILRLIYTAIVLSLPGRTGHEKAPSL
ncbi:DUF4386 family protein [Candidatus Bathyarchaeota archaeon]|nr:DUF4386 family protein [Candidatus Bathyarchaeota archaeon]